MGINIGAAISALRDGHKIRREGWTDIDFLYLVDNSRFVVNRPPLAPEFEGKEVRYSAHIDAFKADPDAAPGGAEIYVKVWTPTHSDLLANDWTVVA